MLLEQIAVLPALYTRVFLPPAVVTELQDLEAPAEVRAWVANLPAWCEVRRPAPLGETETLANLGAGEREAILLAQELRADVLLIDEEDGRQAAWSRALTVTGTLGILERAAERGLLDLPRTLAQLLTTTFRVRDELIQSTFRTLCPGVMRVFRECPQAKLGPTI